MRAIDIEALTKKYLDKLGDTSLTPIPNDTLKTLYLDAFNKIGWVKGIGSLPEVKRVEDKLNGVWLDCMEGKATLEEFKATLKEWERVIKEAIKEEIWAAEK